MFSTREFAKRSLVFVPTHEKAITGMGVIFRNEPFIVSTTLSIGSKALDVVSEFPKEDFGCIALRLFVCVKTTHGIVRLQKPGWSSRKSVFDDIIKIEHGDAIVRPQAFQLSLEPRGFMFDDIIAKPKFRVELDKSDWELDPKESLLDSREKLERLNGRDLPKRFMEKCFDLIERPA